MMSRDRSPEGLFRFIEAVARPLMEGYQCDLQADAEWLVKNPDRPFVHITRKTGTHIFPLPRSEPLIADAPERHVFGMARPSEIYRQYEEVLREQMMTSAVLCLVFDGARLKRMSMPDAITLYRRARLRALSLAKAATSGNDRVAQAS